MKSKIYLIFFLLTFNSPVCAENILIESKNITLDKINEISIFKNEVYLETEDGDKIVSDYAEYNRKTGIIKLKENIKAIDAQNNEITTNYAEYNEKLKI